MAQLSLASTAASALAYCYAAGMPPSTNVEITMMHPDGPGTFPQVGSVFVDTIEPHQINISRWVIQFPYQQLPEHKHLKRDEEFVVVKGTLFASVGLNTLRLGPGEKLKIPATTMHSVQSGDEGCIFKGTISKDHKTDVHWGVITNPRVSLKTCFRLTDSGFMPVLRCMIPQTSRI